MNMTERASLAVRIRIELEKMGGLKMNLDKVKAVILRETRNQKDAVRVFAIVEALEFGTTR